MTSQVVHHSNFLLHLQERDGFDKPVLVKESARVIPTKLEIQQLHNEYTITRQMVDNGGIRLAYAIEGSKSHPVLLLEYIQGKTIRELVLSSTLELRQKLRIAIEAATIVGHIHQKGITHKDINSNNILVSDEGLVHIIDFGMATALKREYAIAINSIDVFHGTFAYISPEQTGRLNRAIDYRSDIYSLGITLYELFTGLLPFQADDVLTMFHQHIAQTPVPPDELDTNIPEPLSDIILKLMAKNAEDRYQSATGLQNDLAKCLQQLQTTGQIQPFQIGHNDFSDRLQISQKLYGRQTEIETLHDTFERVRHGGSELLLVAGYSGNGKTSLVYEIYKPIIANRGIIIEGKFDQYQRGIPYYGWGQAFNRLVNVWLAESDDELARLKTTILDAVGDNGRILFDLIPNLTQIIGPQPEVDPIGGTELENRFNYFFQKFLNVIATPEQQLVVFLDDMQWMDLASMKLLKVFLADRDSGNFLIIGAYRDNEVDSTHPLTLGLNDIRKTGAIVNQITLDNLTEEEICQLLADSLHLSHSSCLPLAQLLHEKTGGNSLFLHQYLHNFEEEGLLWFDKKGYSWNWNMAKLKDSAISDNVVDLMVNKISKLPEDTQESLKIAACLGNQFKQSLFNQVTRKSPEENQKILQTAYQDGLLKQLNGSLKFAHDRIQQAAYSMIADVEKVHLHYRIGQTLLQENPQVQKHLLFDTVNHLNQAIPLIQSDARRAELANLNLKAAQDAMQSAAFDAAETYTYEAIKLLGENGWQTHYSLMLELHQLAAEATYLTKKIKSSFHYTETILAQAHSVLDQNPARITEIRLYHAQNQMQEAIDTGIVAVNDLGFAVKGSPPLSFSVQAVSELPIMSDPMAMAASDVLDNILVSAYLASFEQFPGIIFTALHILVESGIHPSSSAIIFWYALLLWDEDIDMAYQFSELSMHLAKSFGDNRRLGSVRTLFVSFFKHWKTHYRNLDTELRSSFQLGFASGEKALSSASLTTHSFMTFFTGYRLDEVQETLTINLTLQQKTGEIYPAYSIGVWAQFIANLRGLNNDPYEFEGHYFSENRDLPITEAANLSGPTFFIHCLKQALYYHLGRYSSAYANSLEVEYLLKKQTAHLSLSFYFFYQSLSILQLPAGQDRHPNLTEKLAGNISRIRLWAKHAPMNQQHRLDLLLAEKARVDGNDVAAIDHYESAIMGARENEYIREEALANELYGRFWVQRGNSTIARIYIRDAHALYRQWGAEAIVQHLESQFPQWLNIRTIDTGPLPPLNNTGQIYPDLEIHSILKASQSIALDIDLDRLLHNMINIVMENAGAERGFLILEQDKQWQIAVQSSKGLANTLSKQWISVRNCRLLAERIVNYVARTKETVVLDNASTKNDFSSDPYLQQQDIKSILCIPLLNKGKVLGILYLENNLTKNAFTLQHQEVLRLLSSQMAISIEHAHLYERLEQLLEERSRALDFAEAQIRSLFDNSPLGITLTSFDGEFLTVNTAFLDMLGILEEELTRRGVRDFYVEPADRETLLAEVQRSGSVQDFGIQLKRKDGDLFNASVNMSRLILEGKEVLLTIVEDVTAEITAEQEAAVLEERERLARDLHDAVTQTLFSASLIAQAAPRMMDKNPTVARQNMEQLALLIRGALAEMRALLLELRPIDFAGKDIAQLFELLAESARIHTRANVSINVDSSFSPPEDVTIAMYRIAQESLNNVAKHALASEVVIDLACDIKGAKLSVKDDGRGFNPQDILAGHLGVSIMRERAQQIGATIMIDSEIGRGTQVNVAWSAAGNTSASGDESEHE